MALKKKVGTYIAPALSQATTGALGRTSEKLGIFYIFP
jgi:hypothetical protein